MATSEHTATIDLSGPVVATYNNASASGPIVIGGDPGSRSAAARHPRTTVVESGSNKSSGTAHRSAITGHYVIKGTAQRHSITTVTENG